MRWVAMVMLMMVACMDADDNAAYDPGEPEPCIVPISREALCYGQTPCVIQECLRCERVGAFEPPNRTDYACAIQGGGDIWECMTGAECQAFISR